MKKSQVVTLIIVAAFVALLVGINSIEPSRVSERQEQEAAEAAAQIAEAEAAEGKQEATLAASIRATAERHAAQQATTGPISTDPYQVEFTCSNGTFIAEIYPEWSPLGAEQFRKIIEAGIYNEARFFRVVPGFVVQWGIPADPEAAKEWGSRNITDEPVKAKNERGTITFAMSQAPNSRTSQVYINLGDNSQSLDGRGFVPFGKIIQGMEVVDAINPEYGQEADQSMIESRGNAYLKEYFPKMDYIKQAVIMGHVSAPAESSEDQQAAAGDSPEAAPTEAAAPSTPN